MNSQLVRISKFLSLVLRHQPHKIDLTLDEQGWARVDELLEKANIAHVPLTRELLQQVVAENDKQRFALSEDGQRIRAKQGHSIQVDLGLPPLEPPELLYHGTATRFLASILEKGLVKGRRHHVHLSADEKTAVSVGQRHGQPVVLHIQARQMHQDKFLFYRSENGVWLTEQVPPQYISKKDKNAHS